MARFVASSTNTLLYYFLPLRFIVNTILVIMSTTVESSACVLFVHIGIFWITRVTFTYKWGAGRNSPRVLSHQTAGIRVLADHKPMYGITLSRRAAPSGNVTVRRTSPAFSHWTPPAIRGSPTKVYNSKSRNGITVQHVAIRQVEQPLLSVMCGDNIHRSGDTEIPQSEYCFTSEKRLRRANSHYNTDVLTRPRLKYLRYYDEHVKHSLFGTALAHLLVVR
ncbi:hypothetical protein J6590_021450 [Homalodisca vitripennis]|nr:hypothetical protein J6590_021450 [Homalodisca vitripennis]